MVALVAQWEPPDPLAPLRDGGTTTAEPPAVVEYLLRSLPAALLAAWSRTMSTGTLQFFGCNVTLLLVGPGRPLADGAGGWAIMEQTPARRGRASAD